MITGKFDITEQLRNNQMCESVATIATISATDVYGKVREDGTYAIGVLPEGVVVTKVYTIVDEPINDAVSIEFGVEGDTGKFFPADAFATKGIVVGTTGLDTFIEETTQIVAKIDFADTTIKGSVRLVVEFLNLGVRREFYTA